MTIPDVPEAGTLPWLDRYTSTAGEIMIWAGISQSQLRNFAAEWERRCWPILAEVLGEACPAEIAARAERDEAIRLERQSAHELGLTVAERDEAQALLRLAPHHQQQVVTLEYELVQARAEVVRLELDYDNVIEDRERALAEVKRLTAQRDEAVMYGNLYRHERNSTEASLMAAMLRLTAERDAMRPVVEAAKELRTDILVSLVADAAADSNRSETRAFYQSVLEELQAFEAAVDQMAPSTPPSTPESDGQGEVAVTDAVEAPRRATGGLIPPGRVYIVGEHPGVDSWTVSDGGFGFKPIHGGDDV